MVKLLQYSDLSPGPLRPQFDRVVALLEAGAFGAAEVKKLEPGPYYRAKLSDADRLIFRFATCRGETYLVLLEIVRHHAYGASRFLRGAEIHEHKLQPLHTPQAVPPAAMEALPHVNARVRRVHILDKILSFDDEQEAALALRPPLILIGSAGSGKTVLTLEKLRHLPGEILYVTHSPFLVDNARELYYANHYESETQDVAFLSFMEYVQSISALTGRALTFAGFATWFREQRGASPIRDVHALYEEFHGVLTGSAGDRPYLTRDDYLGLGVRRSIFTGEDRPAVYTLFLRYLDHVRAQGFYDLNIACFERLASTKPTYDFVVADEVQDLTGVQLSLVLKSLRQPDQFVLCGDANQIVHPNFFSWAGVKSLFYEQRLRGRDDIIRILNANYRNSRSVTDLANRLLRIKHARFGSIDHESHYLVKPVSEHDGTVEFLPDAPAVRRDIDARTGRSTRFAVLVMREEDKESARQSFRTPLVFSVREAKGLEYENIILLNFVSANAPAFRQIVNGVRPDDLGGDFTFSRTADKGDKSLEILKFFINALYVAITRAVRNVYLIEHCTDHPLLGLLRLQQGRDASAITAQQSSDAEWIEEARRLERQGKTEQVEAIRRTVLRQEPVPWTVLTPHTVGTFAPQALDPKLGDAKARMLLLDYAVTFTALDWLAALRASGFKPAQDLAAARARAQQRHAEDYHQRGYRELHRKLDRHGVDFRNPLNQTPLMLATQLGLTPLVDELMRVGANPQLRDNWGRTPLQIALRGAYTSPQYAKTILGDLYGKITPAAMNVFIADRLVQIDAHRMEFFLLNSMLALFEFMLRAKLPRAVPGFETADFVGALAHFPEHVIPAHRRSRQAITAALAGHEVFRLGPGRNRQLFIRIKRGYYLPNPCMALELEGVALNVCALLNFDALRKEKDNPRLMDFLDMMDRIRVLVLKHLTPDAPMIAPEMPAPAPVTLPVVDTPPAERASESEGSDELDGSSDVPSAGRPVPAAPPPIPPPLPESNEADTHMQALRAAQSTAPREAITWLLQHRELAVNGLLNSLGMALWDPDATVRTKSNAHFLATYMLAQLRETRACPYLLGLMALPQIDALFGEAIPVDLPRIVASVFDDDLEALCGLIRNRAANEWARAAGASALVPLVLAGRLPRGDAIRLLRRLLENAVHGLERVNSPVWDAVALSALNLHPAELMDVLESAFHEGLIDPGMVSMTELIRAAQGSVTTAWDAARRRDHVTLIDDALTELVSWDRADDDPEDKDGPPDKDATAPAPPPLPWDAELPFSPDSAPPRRHPPLGRLAADEPYHAPPKTGRNEPCPCGSGRKFKKCCGL